MSSQPGGSKWVGNAGLIIGLPWDKRKSLPRNSKGFEPVEGYFDRTTSTESSDSDDDSSETDTEELVRQEREKRIEAEARRKVVEEAKSNAAYLMRLVAQEKEAKAQQQREREAQRREEERRQREREEAERREEERRQREEEARMREQGGRQQDDCVTHTRVQDDVIVLEIGEVVEELDVGSNTEVFALPRTSRPANTSEGLYSPDMSVVVQDSPSSVLKKSTRLLPSRLSFGGGDDEETTPGAEPTNTTKRKSRQAPPPSRKSSKSTKKLESTFLSASQNTDAVSLTNDDSLIQLADHILATTESSFHPGKTSTQLKKVPPKKSGRKVVGSKPARRLPSAILALDRLPLSGSDSEKDETLEVLLADDDGNFKRLKTHLEKQSQVQQVASDSQSTAASVDSAKDKTVVAGGGGGGGEKGNSRRHFAKKSTGNMAGKLTQKSKPRKSVTFAAGSSSEFDTEEEYRNTKRTTEASPTALDNIYMSFEEDNFDPPLKKITRAKKPKKVKKPPVQSGDPAQEDAEREEDVSSIQSEEHSSRLKNGAAKLTLSAVNGSRKSTSTTAVLPVEGEVPANRPKDRRARVSETPERDSTKTSSSSNSILENVSLLLNKPPPQQAQWFVPGMELYQRRRKTKSFASSTVDSDSDERTNRKRGRSQKSAASESQQGSKSEAKGRGRGRLSKHVAPPLSPEEAPPTHATTALVSSESEVEERDLTLVNQIDQESTAEVAEPPKSKKSHRPLKSSSQLKQSVAVLVSSESELEGETITHEKVEESPPKRKRGRPHKSSTLTPGTALVSRKSHVRVVEEADLPPEEPERAELEQTATQENPKRKQRGRQRKPMQEATSSESELDDWLETVREQRDGVEADTQQKSLPTNESSSLEKIVGKLQKTVEGKRGGKGRSRKSKAKGQSASSGNEMEGENKAQQNRDEVQRGRTKQSKRGRGRLQKVVPNKPAASASSESELEGMEGYDKSETESEAERQGLVSGLVSAGESTGEGEGFDESAYVESEAVVKKSKAKSGRGRPRKSAAPTVSAAESTESEEVEELVNEPVHRDVPPPVHPPPAAPNDDGLVMGEGGEEEMSQNQTKKKKKKKKNKKAKHQIETENLSTPMTTVQDERQPVVEVGDEQQFDNFIDGDGDYDSPLSPADLYDDDNLANNPGSEVTNNIVPPAATTPGSAGSRGGEQAADLSGAQSVDVSVLPRLIKRKRARGSRVVVAPKSKKQKKAKQMFDDTGTVQDPSTLATPQGDGEGMMGNDTYSMSTSGDEGGEESDHFDGAEIIQSGGGRKYRRLRVEPKKSHTPGVRRSKRTRVAPVRHWENEQLEYDLNTSGAVLKGVLVPLEQEQPGPSQPKRPLNTAMIPERQLGAQEDDGFSPYRITDDMGNTSEMAIVRTLASASRMSCSGEVVTEDSDAEVIIHKLHSSPGTANGVMTFAALGEKPRSSAKQFDMFFFVLKGKLLFQVDDQEFVLMPNSSINIPEGCIYCIRNTQHSRAEVYFYTHYTGSVPQ